MWLDRDAQDTRPIAYAFVNQHDISIKLETAVYSNGSDGLFFTSLTLTIHLLVHCTVCFRIIINCYLRASLR